MIHARIVTRRTEPRPQAPAVEIEPAYLMAGRLLSSGGNLDEHIAEAANGGDWPRVPLRAERRFHLACKTAGLVIGRTFKNTANQFHSGFDRCIGGGKRRRMSRHGLWFGSVELFGLCLFAAQFELQPPAMLGVPRFTPEFERANLCETDSEANSQIQLAQLLAVTQ